MSELEQALTYKFNSRAYLTAALTHSSYANEHRSKNIVSNERLEFLGDAVLELIISEHIYANYNKLPEGELTKIRAAVVCEQSLFCIAKKLDIGNYLLLGKGEENMRGHERPSILADAVEAIIAAIYIDGGFESAKKVVLKLFEEAVEEAANGKINRDYKTILQEIVQKNKEETIEYVLVSEEGPDHSKVFTVELHLNSNIFSKGTGRSKKEAEQACAKAALMLMGEE